MRVREIYDKYKIMPNLQEHMLRVAGLAKIIGENYQGKIDQDLLMKVTLLHDMGNIVKFDLSVEGGEKYGYTADKVVEWEKIQNKFINKYGDSAHQATNQICFEIGAVEVARINDEREEKIKKQGEILSADPVVKIFHYTDLRVVPKGVVRMEKRIADLKNRYGTSEKLFEESKKLERELNEVTTVDILNLSEEDVKPLFPSLLSYEI